MEDYVQLNEEHRVLVCKLCCAGIRPRASIEWHFRNQHQLTGQALGDIVNYFGTREELNDPLQTATPNDGTEPIDALQVLSGYSCTQCRYLTTARKKIAQHRREARHRQERANGLGWTEVKLQSWLRGRYARYWIVEDGNMGSPTHIQEAAATLGRGESAMQRMIAKYVETFSKDDAERLRKGDIEEGLDRDSSWVKRLRWVRHFGSRDKLSIFKAAEWVKAKEATGQQWQRRRQQQDEAAVREQQLLLRLGESFDREVERCSWRLDSVPTETLQWLASISAVNPQGVPFGLKGKESSMAKYRSVGQRYLGFCLRAYWLGRDEAFKQWAIRFTDEQWSLLQDVAYELGSREAVPSTQDSGFYSSSGGSGRGHTRRRHTNGNPGAHDKDGSRSDNDDDDDDDDNEDDDDDEDDEQEEEGNGEDGDGDRAGAGAGDEDGGTARRIRQQLPDSTEAPLDRAVFLFMVASIKQRVGGNAYASPLLCFCAAMGIRQRPLGFNEPHLYTGMLAAILWWARLFFVESVFESEPEETEEVDVDAVLAFQKEHATWMCIGTHTVMSTIIGWMAYGKGWRLKMGGQPSIRWADDGEALFQDGERIEIKKFTKTVRDVVTEAEELLDGMMGGARAKVVDEELQSNMGRITDDLLRVGAGQSFATNVKNEWLEPGPGKVMGLMEKSVWDAARGRWKRPALRRWLRELRRFREALVVLVHTWAGQPGRGPEVMTLRHCDSWQLIRNVFVIDGQVMIVTDRDKMKVIRDNGRKVARFLPDRIGRMVVAYIAWLMPAERMLRREGKLAEPRGDQLEFMWRNGNSRVWGTDRLSAVMGRFMKAGTGVWLGVGRYRPLVIEMGRKIRGLAMNQAEAHMQQDDGDEYDDIEVDPMTGEPVDCGGSWNIVWDLQATHGTRVALQHYAVHIGLPGRLQPEMIRTFREISRLWHQFLEGDGGDGGKGQGDGSSGGSGSGSTTKVAGTKRKAGPAADNDNEVQGQEQQQQQGQQQQGQRQQGPQQQQHSKRARLDLTTIGGTGGEDIQPEPETASDAVKVDVVIEELGRLLGSGATWRSEKQAESMHAILDAKAGRNVISVLPTGAGKSILFMLPGIMKNTGTSIVVVPFVALIEDLMTRAREVGVDCVEFKTSISAGRESLPRAARLVVVSADVVQSAEFTAYADGLLAAGLLQRIFIDECHTIIMDASYRAKLAKLRSLHRYGCPLVLLTATLPSVLEDWFREEMLVPGATTRTIRDRTTKANCQYRVDQVAPRRGAVEERTVEMVRRLGSRMTGHQKGVVYCKSQKQCEAMAEEIGCDFHHSGMSEEDRRRVRTAWAEGQGHSHRWIVATTGLGTGIDIAGIVAVIHMEQPYGLVDFVQQTGRGGRRAGEVVQSVIVHDGRPAWADPHSSFVDEVNRAQMKAFMSTPGCRRTVIAAFMDGKAGETCRDVVGAVPCDYCGRDKEGDADADADDNDSENDGENDGDNDSSVVAVRSPQDKARVWETFGKEEGMRIRTLLRWLDEVADECPVCHVRRHYRGIGFAEIPDQPRHEQKEHWCDSIAGEDYEQVRRKVTFGPLACCFTCKLPLDWCEEARQGGGEGNEDQCVYKDKVLPVVLIALKSWRVKRLAQEQFGISTEDRDTYYQWLGGSRRFHGMNGTNALALWEAVLWEAYQGGSTWFSV